MALLKPLLWLLSLIYGAIVVVRNKFYDWGIFKSQRFDIPVFCVGNVTVGGTGKTPHTEYIAGLLGDTFRVAVLLRGYKRKSKGFRYVEINGAVAETGDEALQIKRKFPKIIVAVDTCRTRGIENLQRDYPDLQAVLLDDAFQHRAVTPSFSVALVDYNQPVWKDRLLPLGRLRDCKASLHRADLIVVTKCPATMFDDDAKKCVGKLRKYFADKIYFSRLISGEPQPLNTACKTVVHVNSTLLAVSGIANPATFFRGLTERYPDADLDTLVFPDHHDFSENDIGTIKTRAGSRNIITTEKDAVRLLDYFRATNQTVPDNLFYIPVKVGFIFDGTDDFNSEILCRLR
jgi:tetraacyldisaccharide 4'-kinase